MRDRPLLRFATVFINQPGSRAPREPDIRPTRCRVACFKRRTDHARRDKLVESASTNPPTIYGFGHEGYYRNVLGALRGGVRPDIDGREGRKSLELVLGIYASARTGRDVPLPLRDRF